MKIKGIKIKKIKWILKTDEELKKDYYEETMDIKELKEYLAEETGCAIQHDGWPCGSCFSTIDIELKEDIREYWQPVLSVRGDYDDYDWEKEWPDEDTSKFPERANELYHALKGATNE